MKPDEIRDLLLSEAGFSALLEASTDNIFVHAIDGRFVLSKISTLEEVGYSIEELSSSHFLDLVVPEERERSRAEFEAVTRGERREYMLTSQSPEGPPIRAHLTQTPIRKDGEVFAVLGIGRDLDLVEQAERAARTAIALDSISDGVVFLDADWKYTYMNPAAEVIAQRSASGLIGKVIWDEIPQLAHRPIGLAHRQAARDQVSTTAREYIPEMGIWMEATAYPALDGLAVLLRDVTESENSERRLREQESLLASQAALLDNASDAIIVRDLDGTVRYWNKSSARIYGWSRDEILGKSVRTVLYVDPTDFDNPLAQTLRDGQWKGELHQISKTGENIIVESSWTLVLDSDGKPESVFSINTDITEKRKEEQLALRTQRMESLGTLASGIAHDLNNVLTPILMSIQMLAPEEGSPQRRELLESMEAAVKRGADMIRQVLSFATGATGRRDPVNVASLLTEVTALAQDWPDHVTLDVSVQAELWGTNGDETQLVQVIQNLIANARDSMPSGGTVRVRASNEILKDSYSSVSHLALPGSYVVLEVEDEGSGIPHDELSKIFEPFFTTKQPGEGTGLGLSTSLAIIRGHGGYMQAYSELGRGSLFRIHLPAEQKQPGRAADRAADDLEEIPRGNGELILVVDDEAAIRHLTRQILEAHGYTTLVASNGAEAIDIIESGEHDVALVLTDMAMPVMDGAATAAYLLENHPHIAVIAASGLGANGGVARAASSGLHAFLAKPYTTEELIVEVHKALNGEQ
jgi:PAS domain S-box-containing protein